MIKKIELDDELESQSGETLIRAYGQFWSRHGVNWKEQKLRGYRLHYRKNKRNPVGKEPGCDAWEQQGIYALYSEFKLVYVGLTVSKQGLGDRLRDHHTKPRLAGRWDTFSWFGLRGFDNSGKLKPYNAATAVKAVTLARTLELAAILIADPPMNRAGGKFPGAERINQVQIDIATSEERLDEILRELQKLQLRSSRAS